MNDSRAAGSDVFRVGVLAGLCLVIGVFLIVTTVLIARDGVFYIERAQQLAEDPVGVARGHPPGYPLLLWAAHEAALRFAGNDSPLLWVYSAQAITLLCRVLAVVVLYFLGRLLVGAKDSFWAVLILVVLPYPAEYGSDVLREWPYLLFLALGFWLLVWALRNRHGWALGLVGLSAGLGYLIRPESGQLILYALLGLICCGFSTSGAPPQQSTSGGVRSRLMPVVAGLLLLVGFAAPVGPYTYAVGTIVPHALRPRVINAPPVVSAVGSKAAADVTLEFEVRAGELLELPIEASDPDGDPLTLSIAGVPVGTRPVYQFRSGATGASFWTISDREKDSLLATYRQEVCRYEGIAWYAYDEPAARAGLQAVHRFWSPSQRRHFYTADPLEKEAILKELREPWKYEGITFYAFAKGDGSADAAAVYRFYDEQRGYFWATERAEAPAEAVAWYVPVAGEPPAGAALEGRIFRWRPGPDVRGERQINIIVDDGQLQSCQLVRIYVVPRRTGADAPSRSYHAGLAEFPGAVDKVFDTIAENLMVFFLAPWLLGLYYRLRYKADPLERTLIVAFVATNIALMLVRHTWFGSQTSRRYSLALIGLTVFYIPPGLTLMAQWLGRLGRRRGAPGPSGDQRRPAGFYILAAIGIGICAPKLLTSLHGQKAGYRVAAAWLCENTRAEDVVAVPDLRISFYAGRSGFQYEGQPDVREARYVVTISGAEEQPRVLDGWREVWSVATDRQAGDGVVIYDTDGRK